MSWLSAIFCVNHFEQRDSRLGYVWSLSTTPLKTPCCKKSPKNTLLTDALGNFEAIVANSKAFPGQERNIFRAIRIPLFYIAFADELSILMIV
jgi:hypothetical protein